MRTDDPLCEGDQDKSGPCPIRKRIHFALFEFVSGIHLMAQIGSSRKRIRHVHLRAPEDLYATFVSMARHRNLPLATVILQLAEEGIAARRQGRSQTIDEMALHNLVASEQIIALLESFMPRGQGAAGRLLERALIAARSRLVAGHEESLEGEPEGAGSPSPPPRQP